MINGIKPEPTSDEFYDALDRLVENIDKTKGQAYNIGSGEDQTILELALLIQFIARNESISISENELKDGMVNYASQYPGQEKQIIEYFKKNPSSIENIRGPLLENKVIENIISKAKINNKKLSIEEQKKLQDQVFKLSGE